MTLHALLRQKPLSNASFTVVGVAQLVKAPVRHLVDRDFKPRWTQDFFFQTLCESVHI